MLFLHLMCMPSSIKIIVPNNNSQEDWFQMLIDHKLREAFHEEVLVDFNEVDFLEVDDLVVLACLIELYHTKGSKIEFCGGTKSLNGYLENIKFKKYWEDGFDRNKYTASRNKTTLCLWKINPSMIYSYSNHAKNYFGGFVENKDLIPLASNMDEVFNNILDHAHSSIPGYIITQYYPKSNQISFSVCDLGIGIAESVNSFLTNIGEHKIEDFQAIMRALQIGFSVKSSPRNKGLGLYHILKLVEKTNGTLLIRSNKGFLFKKADSYYNVGAMNVAFPGTLIKVRVDLNHFEDKDPDEILASF
jgi:anti-sigma regulatory factor (Ser/Thr protein kinase)